MKVYPPNKQFKSDSARLAFLVWVEFGVYGAQIKCRGRVLHTLIGRYVSDTGYNLFQRYDAMNRKGK
ncbi:hypothetical protein D8T25_22630 [Vibrio vulnificus]|nr:hypothetical protein D8T25_22630 [Vibrio vulnificus]